ncbi:hypothetical protein AAT19DRAFT_12753 [Rhodotorula toruloides]|uniref:NodB homology domain-containing protein n=1 Tax=Rhodotorula toruloides TaxID=5286 RepID=A0A2T0ACK1_RHOTO|nr:hypothetical protein AAT19DRAFT_12753 [Rhodotorula toruloides]
MVRLTTLALLLSSAAIPALAVPARLSSSDLNFDDAVANLTSSTLVERGEIEGRAVSVQTKCKKSGQFALTFDDGPLYGSSVASLLESNGERGTFFVNGYNYDCIYAPARVDDLVKRYKAGHVIGSHTWGHVDISKITPAQLNKQLDLVETALKKILGIKPRFFRPPYGSYNDAALKVLQQRGYTGALIVNWDFDSGDSTGKSASQSIAAYKKIKTGSPTYQSTVKTVMPAVIPMLRQKGWKLVSMADCLGMSPYQSVGSPGKRDSSWTCSGTPGPGQT